MGRKKKKTCQFASFCACSVIVCLEQSLVNGAKEAELQNLRSSLPASQTKSICLLVLLSDDEFWSTVLASNSCSLGNREMFFFLLVFVYALAEPGPRYLPVNRRPCWEERLLHNFGGAEQGSKNWAFHTIIEGKSRYLHLHIGKVLCCTATARSGSKWHLEVTFWN